MDRSTVPVSASSPALPELRSRWRELTQQEAPPSFRAAFLARAVAYAQQAQSEPQLTKTAAQRLALAQRPASRSADLKIGSRLIRSWRGDVYEVEVSESGFSWRGEHYPSLTKVATAITGTHWNGPAFFGLRGKATIHG